jgi:predicted phosphodiesterase
VSGHSHVPKIETPDGVLYLNPGSAGRRRFGLPITLATIDIRDVIPFGESARARRQWPIQSDDLEKLEKRRP